MASVVELPRPAHDTGRPQRTGCGRLLGTVAAEPVPARCEEPHTQAVSPGSLQQPRVPSSGDPSIIVAPPGIDEAMIVTARVGIDEAMIVKPGQLRTGPLVTQPIPPPAVTGRACGMPGQWHLGHHLPVERPEGEPDRCLLKPSRVPGTF